MQIRVTFLRMARTQVMTACVLITSYLPGDASGQQINDATPHPPQAEANFHISATDIDKYLSAVNLKNWDDGGELSRFVYLRTSLVFPAANVQRAGPVSICGASLIALLAPTRCTWLTVERCRSINS